MPQLTGTPTPSFCMYGYKKCSEQSDCHRVGAITHVAFVDHHLPCRVNFNHARFCQSCLALHLLSNTHSSFLSSFLTLPYQPKGMLKSTVTHILRARRRACRTSVSSFAFRDSLFIPYCIPYLKSYYLIRASRRACRTRVSSYAFPLLSNTHSLLQLVLHY
jgi:hypothetical protein